MRTWRYDLHTHPRPTRNGADAVQKYVDAAVKAGLDGIGITEHSHTEGVYLLPELNIPDGFSVLQGQELASADAGHVLVYGWPTTLKRRTDTHDLTEACFVRIQAHPFRKPSGVVHGHLDAIEVHNGGYKDDTHARALMDWHRWRYTATGGSDAHRARHVGRAWTCFPYQIRDVGELIAAIRSGHCWPGRKGEQ